MTIREFYAVADGNYDEAIGRLMNEKRILKYLRKLPATDDYKLMNEAFASGSWEEAFRYSHNLKGVSLNLSITSLGAAADALCNTVRHGPPTVDFSGLLEDVNRRYESVVAAIAEIEDVE